MIVVFLLHTCVIQAYISFNKIRHARVHTGMTFACTDLQLHKKFNMLLDFIYAHLVIEGAAHAGPIRLYM